MSTIVLPKVAISSCLLGRAVRYDGGEKKEASIIAALRGVATLMELCPEVELGLGVPRPPIDVVVVHGQPRLISSEGERDITGAMEALAESRVAELVAQGARGAICKSRSPSCGVGTTPYLPRRGGEVLRLGDGFFVLAWRRIAPSLPIIDSAAFADAEARAAFLSALAKR